MTTAYKDRYMTIIVCHNWKYTARQLSSDLAVANKTVASQQTV